MPIITLELPESAESLIKGEEIIARVGASVHAPVAAQTVSATMTPLPRLTCDEFLDWLDEDKHAEWVDGRIVLHDPVSRKHTQVGGLLIGAVRIFVEDNDLGEVAYDPFQMRIDAVASSRAPDILFAAKENLHRLKKNYLDGPADLVVEIISPESRGRDRGDKHFEYEKGGVREYWLLDPERRLAEFYRLGADGRYALVPLDAEGCFHSTVLPGLWLNVDWLWQEPLPTVRDILRAWEAV